MKILLESWKHPGVRCVELARELGLEEADILLGLEAEIQARGMIKDNRKMVARNQKEIANLFPWCSPVRSKRLLESLRDRNYIYIIDETIIARDTTKWYAMNWPQVQTLKSIVVLDEGDIVVPTPTVETKQVAAVKINGNDSHAHNEIFKAFLVACNFDRKLMSPRDTGEVGQCVKKIMTKYPKKETEDICKMVRAFRVYWCEIEPQRFKPPTRRNPPRPFTILSQWENYSDYCKTNLGGSLPVSQSKA